MVNDTIGSAIVRWAASEPRVEAVIQIGSQVRRETGAAFAADEFSDWDFQLLVADPRMMESSDWLAAAGLARPLAYVCRVGRLGRSAKVSVVFSAGALDLVLIPTAEARQAEALWRAGEAETKPPVLQAMRDLAAVLIGGYKFHKGGEVWSPFYDFVATHIAPPRLDDAAVRALADGFVCDYVSTRQKISRGECAAAQRWVHHLLAETNYRLLHEWRLRQGLPSMPDARRLEGMIDASLLEAVRPNCAPFPASLERATEVSAETLRYLVRQLLGQGWSWPAGLDATIPRARA